MMFQIQSDLDLSGTLVDTLYPVNVVSGVYLGSVGSASAVDYMADSVLPLNKLGSEYLIPPVQYGDEYAIKVIGKNLKLFSPPPGGGGGGCFFINAGR